MRQNRNMNTAFQINKRETWQQIRDMYKQGWTITAIEYINNVSNSTVNRALKGMRNRRTK